MSHMSPKGENQRMRMRSWLVVSGWEVCSQREDYTLVIEGVGEPRDEPWEDLHFQLKPDTHLRLRMTITRFHHSMM